MGKESTWIVFTIMEEKFALPSTAVREILYNVPVDSLPLAPDFLCQMTLWQGSVYGVLDPAPLLGYPPQNTSICLLLYHKSSVCIKITSVITLCTLPVVEVQSGYCIPGETFFCGAIDFAGQQVRIICQDDLIGLATRRLSYGST